MYAFDPTRTTNARLVEDLATLGYLKKEWLTLDPTYGRGRFWKLWRPKNLWMSDIDPAHDGVEWGDFTNLRWATDWFDAVVFDPPYKLNGTGGSHASDEGYAVDDKLTMRHRHDLIYDGIDECLRVLKQGGIFIMKCQDQVSSGKVRWQTIKFALYTEGGIAYRAELIDMLFVCGGIPQPPGRRQVHARRNYSTALIFAKSK